MKTDEFGDVDDEFEVKASVINDQEMTLAEAAERYGVLADTLKDRIQEGKLEARKSGPRVWLVTHAAMRKYRGH